MKATVNGGPQHTLEPTADGWLVDGQLAAADVQEIQSGRYHVLANGKSFTVEVIATDPSSKKHTLKINGAVIEVQLRDQYDELLHALGIDTAAGKKSGDLKAPMPGLVVDVAVSEGQTVEKGDTLVVLEAMKMENALKAAGSAVVKKIMVQKGATVDKNQVLIQLG